MQQDSTCSWTLRPFVIPAQGRKYQSVIFIKPQKWKVQIPVMCRIWIFQDCQRCWLQVIWTRISSGGKHALYWWKRDRGKKKLYAETWDLGVACCPKICGYFSRILNFSITKRYNNYWVSCWCFRINFPLIKVSIEDIFFTFFNPGVSFKRSGHWG